MELQATQLRVGTSGFAYKAWKGSFYPEDLPDGEMLAYYATRLPAVEINNTFYRLPKASVLEGWAARVPEGFRFSLKASRRITHGKRLRDAGDETGYLLRSAATLGSRLGCILFQLPPNLRRDLPRLEAFLTLLPEGTRAAFEFRHPSWRDDAVLARLRDRGCAWCTADTDDAPQEGPVATADWGYVRLRREDYDDAGLARWAAGVTSASWREAYVFFKHEEAGAGPLLAERFLAQAGAPPARRPPHRVAAAARSRRTG